MSDRGPRKTAGWPGESEQSTHPPEAVAAQDDEPLSARELEGMDVRSRNNPHLQEHRPKPQAVYLSHEEFEQFKSNHFSM